MYINLNNIVKNNIYKKENVKWIDWFSKEKIIDLINKVEFVSSINLYKDLLFILIEDKKADM